MRMRLLIPFSNAEFIANNLISTAEQIFFEAGKQQNKARFKCIKMLNLY